MYTTGTNVLPQCWDLRPFKLWCYWWCSQIAAFRVYILCILNDADFTVPCSHWTSSQARYTRISVELADITPAWPYFACTYRYHKSQVFFSNYLVGKSRHKWKSMISIVKQQWCWLIRWMCCMTIKIVGTADIKSIAEIDGCTRVLCSKRILHVP